MLDGILTTALQIIIVLDICGAVFYFLMSGAAKHKEAKASASPTPQGSPAMATGPQFAMSSQLQPAMAGAGSVQPPPIPDWVSSGDDRSAAQIYGVEGAAETAPPASNWSARIGNVFSSIKQRFQRQNTGEIAKTADLNSDRVRLNKVLESFREEM